MSFYVRLDEEDKTPEQLMQRERTYQAAKLLRAAGFDCQVIEYFTGKDPKANAAAIVIGEPS
jgi:predicted DNA-binding helix-hairpin-helix protein